MAATNVQAFSGDLDIAGAITSNLEVGTANLFVDTVSGYVGIGTVGPSNLLHVYKANNDETSGILIEKANGGLGTAASLFFGVTSPDETDNRGIPKAAIFYERSLGNGRGDLKFCNDETDDTNPVSTAASDTRMIIKNSGYVGIGLTDPEYKLHIEDLTNPRIMLENTNTVLSLNQDIGSIIFKQNDSTGVTGTGIIGKIRMSSVIAPPRSTFYGESANMIFSVGEFADDNADIDALTIRGNGNVGIGTNNPTEKFHIKNGSIRFDSTGTVSIINKHDTSDYGVLSLDAGYRGGSSRPKIRIVGYQGQSSADGDNLITFHTNGSERMKINQNGNIAINRTSPGYMLDVQGNMIATSGYYVGRGLTPHMMLYADNIGFVGDAGLTGFIEDDIYSTSSFNFTGQHRTFIKDVPSSQADDLEGLIVSADQNKYIKMSGGIERGSNAITINESLPIVSISSKVNDKKCFGVISTSEDPEKREDRYGAFVSHFDKEMGDTRVYINSVGEGAIWVTDINGPLESGDYITTSNVAGYGQKQDSEILANYTVAKITMDCDFNPVTQPIKQIKREPGTRNYWVKTSYFDVTQEEYSKLAPDKRRIIIKEPPEATVYQKILRNEFKFEMEGYELEVREEMVNVLDEHGQLQWEDHPTETEKAYKIRYLDASGQQTDEANAIHIAAFVGCTYHCG
jgi:hypothetical protein